MHYIQDMHYTVLGGEETTTKCMYSMTLLTAIKHQNSMEALVEGVFGWFYVFGSCYS